MSKPWMRANIKITKPLVYFDMDGVLCNFDKRQKELIESGLNPHKAQNSPLAFKDLEPIHGALEAWNTMQEKYETYVLSTAMWSNTHAWTEKRIWVEKYLGKSAHKKLILSHHKGLLLGDYLIDDRIANGVGDFKGEHIHFGSEKFPHWDSVLKYLNV
jgi:5'-nucleotidase